MSTNERNRHNWEITYLTSETKTIEVLAKLHAQRWLCRGQSKCYDNLLPTIDRDTRQGLTRIEKLNLERQSIELFRSTVQSESLKREVMSEDLIALMVLRHYNVPTRLLDWSLSPYVAAYFSVCKDDEENGEIWSFDQSLYEQEGKKQWESFPETTIDGSGKPEKFDYSLKAAFSVEEPNNWFVCEFYRRWYDPQMAYEGWLRRQDAQQGAYSITPRFNRDHAEAIAQLLEKKDHYHKYIITLGLKPTIRKTLREKYGIWQGSLFPDEVGAAETANSVFERQKKEYNGVGFKNMFENALKTF
jgi:hypothetical protein